MSSTVYIVDAGPLIAIERTLSLETFPSFFSDVAALIHEGRLLLHTDISGEIEGIGAPPGKAWLLPWLRDAGLDVLADTPAILRAAVDIADLFPTVKHKL